MARIVAQAGPCPGEGRPLHTVSYSVSRRWSVAQAVLLAAALLVAPAPRAGEIDHAQHRFRDAAAWSKVFDDPRRDEWQKPHEVIQALGLARDAVVADIGAGTGYFASRLAHMTSGGRVYAVDTEPDMVKHLEQRARQAGLTALRTVQAGADDPRLPEPVDLALLVNVYHHVEQRVAYFGRLRNQLKPGGRVAIIDFRPDSPVGPRHGRITADAVKREFAAAGYALAQDHGFLPYQYFLVFRVREAP